MEKISPESVDVERSKELFEHEMTEVLCALNDEFYNVSGLVPDCEDVVGSLSIHQPESEGIEAEAAMNMQDIPIVRSKNIDASVGLDKDAVYTPSVDMTFESKREVSLKEGEPQPVVVTATMSAMPSDVDISIKVPDNNNEEQQKTFDEVNRLSAAAQNADVKKFKQEINCTTTQTSQNEQQQKVMDEVDALSAAAQNVDVKKWQQTCSSIAVPENLQKEWQKIPFQVDGSFVSQEGVARDHLRECVEIMGLKTEWNETETENMKDAVRKTMHRHHVLEQGNETMSQPIEVPMNVPAYHWQAAQAEMLPYDTAPTAIDISLPFVKNIEETVRPIQRAELTGTTLYYKEKTVRLSFDWQKPEDVVIYIPEVTAPADILSDTIHAVVTKPLAVDWTEPQPKEIMDEIDHLSGMLTKEAAVRNEKIAEIMNMEIQSPDISAHVTDIVESFKKEYAG